MGYFVTLQPSLHKIAHAKGFTMVEWSRQETGDWEDCDLNPTFSKKSIFFQFDLELLVVYKNCPCNVGNIIGNTLA